MSRADIKAGSAYVELLMRDKDFTKRLRAAGAGLKLFALSAMSLAGPIAAAFSFGSVIKASSDVEETMNKFNVVFGKNSKEVKQWSDGFAKDVGRSEEQIARFVSNSQDLFVPLGFEAGAATEMSKQITGLSLDLASFNNMQDADTMRDLQAALTGSGEVMKKYGVVLSEAAVKQELLNQKLDPKKASDQEKVQARLNIIMRGTTAAQGDAIRSAGGFANMYKALKGRLFDTAATIGSALLPGVTKLVGAGVDVIDSARGMAIEAIAWWDQMSGTIIGHAQLIWSVVKDVFSGVLDFWTTVWSGISSVVTDVWTTIVDNTIGATTTFHDFILGALSSISFAYKNWRVILETAVTSSMLAVVRFANQTVHLFSEVIPTWLKWFGDNWRDVFTDIANITATIAGNIWNNLKNLWDSIVGLFSGEGFSFEWTPLTEGFESAIKEWPKIAERQMGPLEQSLQDELNSLAEDLNSNWQQHGKEFAKNVDKFLPSKSEFEAVAAEQQDGIQEALGATPNRSQSKKEVVGAFSLSALAAQAGGGDKTVDELKALKRQQAKQHKETIRAMSGEGALQP